MNEPVESFEVVFQPSGRRGRVESGISLLEAARRLGADIETLCGDRGSCGKCKVRIEEGRFPKYGLRSAPTHAGPWQEQEARFISASERQQGCRLACRARVDGDLVVFVPEESRAGKQVVSKAARDIPIQPDPAVKPYPLRLDPPTFEEPLADFERVAARLRELHGLENLSIDLHALRQLPGALRRGQWQITVFVWMEREIIRVLPGTKERCCGMAFDVGTTTLAGYLCDLATTEVLNTQSRMNPQCKYGEDVMSRISFHVMNPESLGKMSTDIIDALNSMLQQAIGSAQPPPGSRHAGIEPEDIVDLTLVGNTTMHHLLLQLDPAQLGMAPFPPVIHRGLDIKARDLGLKVCPGAYVHFLPIQAGFVGADTVGVLVAERPQQEEEIQLIIDIGTNGEIVLGNRERLLCASCATGPAFEGAQIAFGMRAAEGAIERIRIAPRTLEVDYKVIGRDAWKSFSRPEELQVKGICGSGILDLLAELFRAGVVIKSGAFNKDLQAPRLRRNAETGQPEFVIAWKEETSIGRDVVVTQRDVRQIQLAKGALYCGCKLLMRRLGIERPDRVKIAGAFGTHVDHEKALVMGLIPDCGPERIVSIGNAAGDGARAALLDCRRRKEAERIAATVEYVELTLEPGFQKEFLDAMAIPHATDPFPSIKGIPTDGVPRNQD